MKQCTILLCTLHNRICFYCRFCSNCRIFDITCMRLCLKPTAYSKQQTVQGRATSSPDIIIIKYAKSSDTTYYIIKKGKLSSARGNTRRSITCESKHHFTIISREVVAKRLCKISVHSCRFTVHILRSRNL